jgi:7,8-dihydropterin-6-yl-methyl-4-(beta-D-ribofuranosyl)aminobenzene 5'-phosphate synthase
MPNCIPIQVELTMLVENEARGRGLIGEHGLSYHLKIGDSRILFDCGQGMALPHNAQKLGINLNKISHIILSHGHYDHCGGLPSVLKENTTTSIWMHPLATQAKFSGNGGKMHRVSEAYMEAKRFAFPERKIHFTEEPTEVVPGLWVTGTVPRANNYEDTGGAFYLDSEGKTEDPIRDDMSIFFKSNKGLNVILGCAHAGVINTLNHILSVTGETKINTLIGGMHLLHANDERIQRTIKEFQRMGIEYMGPCHCTGVKPVHEIHQAWGHNRFIHCHTGMKRIFD